MLAIVGAMAEEVTCNGGRGDLSAFPCESDGKRGGRTDRSLPGGRSPRTFFDCEKRNRKSGGGFVNADPDYKICGGSHHFFRSGRRPERRYPPRRHRDGPAAATS